MYGRELDKIFQDQVAAFECLPTYTVESKSHERKNKRSTIIWIKVLQRTIGVTFSLLSSHDKDDATCYSAGNVFSNKVLKALDRKISERKGSICIKIP